MIINKKIVLGFPCEINEAAGSLNTGDMSILLFGLNEKEQSFHFFDSKIEDFAEFFEKYHCKSLSIDRSSLEGVVDLDAIKHSERIERLALNFLAPTEIAFSDRPEYFAHLRELSSCPSSTDARIIFPT